MHAPIQVGAARTSRHVCIIQTVKHTTFSPAARAAAVILAAAFSSGVNMPAISPPRAMMQAPVRVATSTMA